MGLQTPGGGGGLKKYADISSPTRWAYPALIGIAPGAGTLTAPTTQPSGASIVVTLPTYAVGDVVVIAMQQTSNNMNAYGLSDAGWTPYSPSSNNIVAAPYRSWPLTVVRTAASDPIYTYYGNQAYLAKKMTDTTVTSVTVYGGTYIFATAFSFRPSPITTLAPALAYPMDISSTVVGLDRSISNGTTDGPVAVTALVGNYNLLPTTSLIGIGCGVNSASWEVRCTYGTLTLLSSVVDPAYGRSYKIYKHDCPGGLAPFNNINVYNNLTSPYNFNGSSLVLATGLPANPTSFSVIGDQFIDNISCLNSSADTFTFGLLSGTTLSTGLVAPNDATLVGPAYLKDESVGIYQFDGSNNSLRVVPIGRPII